MPNTTTATIVMTDINIPWRLNFLFRALRRIAARISSASSSSIGAFRSIRPLQLTQKVEEVRFFVEQTVQTKTFSIC